MSETERVAAPPRAAASSAGEERVRARELRAKARQLQRHAAIHVAASHALRGRSAVLQAESRTALQRPAASRGRGGNRAEPPVATAGGAPRSFPAVTRLVAAAEHAAAQTADPITALCAILRTMMTDATDPYMLAGALVEAIAQIMGTAIPPERRAAAMAATLMLLRERLGVVASA